MITIIKKISFVLMAVLLLIQVAVAQDKKDERIVTTKIADLLAQLPASDAAQLSRNMKEVAELGEGGYATLINGLMASGKGNNAAIQYAVGGFTAAASKNEAWRKMAESAYCLALAKAGDKQNKAFIISQFELVGTEAAVTCLSEYLTDEQLADEASRALVKIHTQGSVDALVAALPRAAGKAKLALVEALGHTVTSTLTATAINNLDTGSDKDLQKVKLFALANLADPSSADLLMKAAEEAGYKYDQTNAVAALLVYAKKMAITDPNSVVDMAKNIAGKLKTDDQVDLRIAALELIAGAKNNQQVLRSAADDSNFEYRAAAIRMAKMDGLNGAEWIGKLAKVDGQTKVLILDKLASSGAQLAIPTALKLVKDKDPLVKTAAVFAVVKLGGESALDDLMKIVSKADTADLDIFSAAILRMKGENLTAKIATYIPKANPEAQVALLHILSARAASGQMGIVYTMLTSKNQKVRKAAFEALKFISTPESKGKLFDLMTRTSDQTELTAVQDAIIASVKGNGADSDVQTETILAQIGSSSEDKKLLYYKVLGSIGGKKALKSVSDAFASGNEGTKKAALDALSSWADAGSAEELIKIARTSQNEAFVNQALTGYLKLVRNTDYPAEQRLLLLRNAMAVAKNPTQQQLILKDTEQAKCFNSIVFAGQYLDNSALQQAAANAVMNITLAGEYNGTIVKNLLNKTISVITGGDAAYQKEGMRKYISSMKEGDGFVQVFNGKDLSGWKGLVADPIKRSIMDAKTLEEEQVKADAAAKDSWKVRNGELYFQSHGDNLATVKKYGDFEMLVDWKIIDDKKGEGDAGIYLRGTPQVQIWDLARTNVGAQVGSGGLYNNQTNPSKPLVVADNKLDEWNTFRIVMKGDRVSVWLNGVLVTDNVILENYWDKNLPIFAEEQIELQAHGSPVAYRDIYIKEIPRPKPFELTAQEKKEGYKILFDGTNMYNWTGNLTDYIIKDGNIAIEPVPGKGSGGNLYTKEEFSDFIYRFEFQLTPGANNGLGIRAPLEGDAAYVGMELQILDNDAPIYKDLHVYQYHGSVYGTIPAKRGFLKPVGEWNYEEVVVKGTKIKVILNGTVILDGDIAPFQKNGTPDHQQHPGLLRETGHIGFLGHGSPVQFRNIRIKDLSKKMATDKTEVKKK
ncbi:HEAT repeat protein [Pedobacter sp. UYP24]